MNPKNLRIKYKEDTGLYPTDNYYIGSLSDEYAEWLEMNFKLAQVLRECYYEQTKQEPTFPVASNRDIGYTKRYKNWLEDERLRCFYDCSEELKIKKNESN